MGKILASRKNSPVTKVSSHNCNGYVTSGCVKTPSRLTRPRHLCGGGPGRGHRGSAGQRVLSTVPAAKAASYTRKAARVLADTADVSVVETAALTQATKSLTARAPLRITRPVTLTH